MTAGAIDELIRLTTDLRLLYVEDNEGGRTSTMEVLLEFFEDITTAENGQQGLAAYEAGAFDLIITDVNMPVMTGMEMIAKIRERDARIPILVISAHQETKRFIDTIKLGVDGYLLKPIGIEQFVDVLMRTARNVAAHRENVVYRQELERKVTEQTRQLCHVYTHDRLTELPNAMMLQHALERGTHTHLVLLDVADFASVVRTFGRPFAEDVLRAVGDALQRQVRMETATLFKIERDRFVILFTRSPQRSIEAFCQQIITHFDRHNLFVHGVELNTTFCIGSVVLDPLSDPMPDAERALALCRTLGRRHFVVLEACEVPSGDEETLRATLKLTRRLLASNGVIPYMQPVKSLESGQIVHYEMLARGVVDDQIIPPHRFLAAAEQLGMISDVTRRMIIQSFALFAANTLEFSINVTERDLLEEYLPSLLTEQCAAHGITPDRVMLEVSEQITTRDGASVVMTQLRKLRAMGVRIAVDNFGIDFINAGRLRDIGVDLIKIDGSLIKQAADGDRAVVAAVVALAKALGIRTLAGGVEDDRSCRVLRTLGIDYAQGFYVGNPQSGIALLGGLLDDA